MDENQITVNLQQLSEVLKEIQSVQVELPQEQKDSLLSIQTDLNKLVEVLTPVPLTEEETAQLELQQQEEKERLISIQDNLNELVLSLTPKELTEEELIELDLQEQQQEDFNNSIQTNLIDLNENISYLTEVIETDINQFNELDDLQIKSYGSNIILMYLVLFALFAKGVFSIFSFFGNKI